MVIKFRLIYLPVHSLWMKTTLLALQYKPHDTPVFLYFKSLFPIGLCKKVENVKAFLSS